MAETKEEFLERERKEIFKSTYNAMYLKNLDLDTILELKKTVNPTLRRLIDNLLLKKTYISEMIEGPKCFYKIKLENQQKTFFIFGEDHKTVSTGHGRCFSNDSLEFTEYIRRLSFETPSFFDLYLELPTVCSDENISIDNYSPYNNLVEENSYPALKEIIKSMIENPSSDFNMFFSMYRQMFGLSTEVSPTFRNISNMFIDCVESSTIENCHLLRMHNIDLRFSWLSEHIYNDFYTHISYFILSDSWKLNYDNQVKINLIKRINRNKAIEVISSLYDFRNEQINIPKLNELIFSNQYMKREIDRVESPIKEQIMDYYKQKIYEILTPKMSLNLKELILCLEDRIPIPEENNHFKPVSYLFFYINAYIMDMYCLSRIFKKYRVKETDFQPIESKNIILYTGAFHSKSYKDFLLSIGGVLKHNSENYENKGCIKMTKRSFLAKLKINKTLEYFEQLEAEAIDKNRLKIIDDLTVINLKTLINFDANNYLQEINDNTSLSDREVIYRVDELKKRISSLYFEMLPKMTDLNLEDEKVYEDIREEGEEEINLDLEDERVYEDVREQKKIETKQKEIRKSTVPKKRFFGLF